MVSVMFVPVSPSGTGKTFNELTLCWLVLSHVRPASTICFRAWPSNGLPRSFSIRELSTLIE